MLFVVLAMAGMSLVLGATSFALAHLARVVSPTVPRAVLIVLCGSLPALALLGAGYVFLVEAPDFWTWAASRPPRAYVSLMVFIGAGCAAAWTVLRRRRNIVDLSIFS